MTGDDIQAADQAPQAAKAVVERQPSLAEGAVRWFKQGNSPLVTLFVMALAGVYLMSLRNEPAAASAQQVQDGQVEIALARWQARSEVVQKAGGSASDLVNTFYYETKQRQIPLDRLGTNPFEFKPPAAAPPPLVTNSTEPQPTGEEAAAIDALSAVKELRLQSILAGPHGATAMISNNILTEGQLIHGWTIIKIEPESVTLKWKDQMVELKMH